MNKIKIHSWHIDYALEFANEDGVMTAHKAPLFIQLPNCYQYQPDVHTEINNLFIASDYVPTTYDLVTIESANEAARRAVNAILKYTQDSSHPCMVKKEVRTGFSAIQLIDKLIYKIQIFLKKINY